jgi:hypothetical protein
MQAWILGSDSVLNSKRLGSNMRAAYGFHSLDDHPALRCRSLGHVSHESTLIAPYTSTTIWSDIVEVWHTARHLSGLPTIHPR